LHTNTKSLSNFKACFVCLAKRMPNNIMGAGMWVQKGFGKLYKSDYDFSIEEWKSGMKK